MTELKIDISRAKSSAVTADHGITPAELKDIQARVRDAHKQLSADRASGSLGFYDLHKDTKTVSNVQSITKKCMTDEIDNLVVLGIGGSALGITTLFNALKSPYHNQLSREERGGVPKLFVMDNIDPDTFAEMMRICPPENTVYNVISKSGGTSETISQFLIILDQLKKHLPENKLNQHVVVTTSPLKKGASPSPLQHLQKSFKLPVLHIPFNVGGRFSIFTPVGLFPAAAMQMDVPALLRGCRAMEKRTASPDIQKNPAYLYAAVQYILDQKKHKPISVMMPYSDKLSAVSDWYAQLWAESLGKILPGSAKSPPQSVGQTPVSALGVTDQHSQLQLYLEGPNDKIITILEESTFNTKLKIPTVDKKLTSIKFLHGKSMNQLMAAERRATVDALREKDRPVVRITFPKVDESTVAQFLYMLEVQTAMAGQLYGIDAFDQPAVELIKIFTRKNMGESRG